MPSKRGVETGEMCPQCGKPLVRNYSKKTHREFVGCSGFKEGCKYIKPGEGEEARAAAGRDGVQVSDVRQADAASAWARTGRSSAAAATPSARRR